MTELESARITWIAERPTYQQFVEHLKRDLDLRLKRVGLWRRVTGRAKDVDTLIKKMISRKKKYEELTDKAGVRVVLRFHDEIGEVGKIVDDAFHIIKTEDKTSALGTKKLGYQGLHFDIELKASDEAHKQFPGLIAEIQVRSLSQDLWSEMAHELNYKSNMEVPPSLDRRLNCLSALVEVADMEFTRIYHDIRQLPEAGVYRMLAALERQFFKLAAVEYNKDLSLDIIQSLQDLYGPEDMENPDGHFEEFYLKRSPKLSLLLEQYSAKVDRSVFLSQPEILMILDLLEQDEHLLAESWSRTYPLEELEKVALFWGKSLNLEG
jgi:ppGpp synthetase/RelA/SpoT-type nucleotidyltranferase